ncbi:MAG: electron transfer flavoprotein subunit beta/FixA family protein [Planctomycetes bacterium]|nr:electron transfer flavoprotein subunit beta/FixA family protein [Planctomycetota bacterium]
MKIVVCVKRVPDTTTQVKVGPDGTSLDAAGVTFANNPYDEYAVEEALKIKEKTGPGEVIVISVGPAEAAQILRNFLAMGADRAILLKETAPGRDNFGVASALAGEIKGLAPDIVLCGKQAVDDDGAQVGAIVARLLGMPVVNTVTKIELAAGKAVAHREIEGGHEVVEVSLPAAFTAQKGLNEPRFPSLKGIMAAKKKPFEEKPAPAAEPRLTVIKMEPPAKRPAGRILGKGVEAIPALVKALHDEAKVI